MVKSVAVYVAAHAKAAVSAWLLREFPPQSLARDPWWFAMGVIVIFLFVMVVYETCLKGEAK